LSSAFCLGMFCNCVWCPQDVLQQWPELRLRHNPVAAAAGAAAALEAVPAVSAVKMMSGSRASDIVLLEPTNTLLYGPTEGPHTRALLVAA
jgi:hypothetical protein